MQQPGWSICGRGGIVLSLAHFTAYRWRTSESDDTLPYTHHPYAYALGDPVLLTDPTGKYAATGVEGLGGCPTEDGYAWVPSMGGCVPLPSSNPRQGMTSNWVATYFWGAVYGVVRGMVKGAVSTAQVARASQDPIAAKQLADEMIQTLPVAGRGLRALLERPGATVRSLDAADWGEIALMVFGAAEGVKGIWDGGVAAGRIPSCDTPQMPSVQAPSQRLQRDIIPDGGGAVDIQNAPYIVTRLIRDQDWTVWGTDASAASTGDFTYLAQSSTVQEALSRIPRSWRMERQASGVGYKFTNPDSTALVTEVRIKVPMARFNPDWQSFAQLRLGKEVGVDYPGADRYGMIYYDRNLHLTTNLDAMHVHLAFDP
jgi:hypothetical protein